jgi:acetoin utilization deacetylase AcuC-like enzyme
MAGVPTTSMRCLDRVMYMSLHRGNGFYPNTGAATDVGSGAGRGFTVNVRLREPHASQ